MFKYIGAGAGALARNFFGSRSVRAVRTVAGAPLALGAVAARTAARGTGNALKASGPMGIAGAGLGVTFMGHQLLGGPGAVGTAERRAFGGAAASQIASHRSPLYQPQPVAGMQPMMKGANSRSVQQLAKIAEVLEKQASMPQPAAPGVAGAVQKAAVEGENTMQRMAWGKNMRKQLAPILAFGAATAAAGTLIGLGEEAIRHGVGRATESAYAARQPQRYAAMIKTDPTLKDHPRARQMFGVLDRVAPFVASEPVLAASAVRQMVEQPTYGQDPRGLPYQGMDKIRQYLDIQRGRQDTRFGAVAKAQATRPHHLPKVDAGIAFGRSGEVTGAGTP